MDPKILWVGQTFEVSTVVDYKGVVKLPSSMTYHSVTVYHDVVSKIELVDAWGKKVLRAGVKYDFMTVQELPTDNCCLLRFVNGANEVLVLRIKKTQMPSWTLAGRLTGAGVIDDRQIGTESGDVER
jgi:hypothetical protein